MAIFTNQATLSYRNGAVSSNVVTGEIVEVVTVTKNALRPTYTAGDVITYVVSLQNTGNLAATDITVIDDLGAYTFGANTLVPLTYVPGSASYYVNGVVQTPAPVPTTGANLTFANLTVPANGNALLIYEARVNEFAPLGTAGEIENTATVTGGGICDQQQATATVTASTDPILGLNKAISPATVTENGQVTYTFTLQNFGANEANADEQLVVSDTFSPTLDPITVTYNGTTWTNGTEYNYDNGTGAISTIAGNITVPAATITQNPVTGEYDVTPGVTQIVVTGTVRCD